MGGTTIARISVLLFTSWKIIKSCSRSSKKLSRGILFRLYFIEKYIIRGTNGRKFERSGWQLDFALARITFAFVRKFWQMRIDLLITNKQYDLES